MLEVIDQGRRLAWLLRKGLPVPAGWEEVGSGHFSKVFSNAAFPDVVVKVSGRSRFGYYGRRASTDEYCSDDGITNHDGKPALDGWQLYAEWVTEQAPHPTLPVIHHFENISSGIAFGVLERLEPSSYGLSLRWAQRLYDAESWTSDAEQAEEFGLSHDPELPPYWVSLGELIRERDLMVDVHEGNTMCRGEQGVLTDPVAGVAAW